MGKLPVGPSHLSKVLSHIKSEPKLSLFGVRSIKLSYAFRNDHFGARHFVKEELPRIKYANPHLKIELDRPLKTKDDHWKPEMELQLDNGSRKIISMQDKWSTTILQELLELSGGEPWKKWQRTASTRGVPLLPGVEKAEAYVPPDRGSITLPNLLQWRASAAVREEQRVKAENVGQEMKAAMKEKVKAKKKAEPTPAPAQELSPEVLLNLQTKTGAAAILP
ncbi:hypothetical protein BDP27DRAFT_1390739 [Rhodocollybia butyracea]|uniref:Ribosomal protein/NADH dehydrogenase domain-containing protein n=1 Tax=Rhodocollybia butyracea TaxID=206335 RepID=A0A9P5UBD1_9AGAR|nr:hypothetical protein BDP27DRAFT_1390739 [Rhodocollybia butyracea]